MSVSANLSARRRPSIGRSRLTRRAQAVLHRRSWLFSLLLPLAWPLAAQQIASDPPVEWQADVKANKQAERAAETAAEQAAPPRGGKDGGGPKPDGGNGGPPGGGMGPDGNGGPPTDGMGDGMGGPGGGGPGGPDGGKGGGKGGGSRVTAASLLRPEMEFAAPLKDTLVLYRTREAVVFGRRKSDAVVVLPLSGEAIEIAPGAQASLHEDAQGLRVSIVTSNGIHAEFHYSQPQAGVLKVKLHAEGPVPRPGSTFEVERVYRGADAR